MTDERTLRIRQNPAMSTLPEGRWPVLDKPPHHLAEHWMRRFLSLNDLQFAIKKMMLSYAPPIGGGLSVAFAELYQDNVPISESTPDAVDMERIQQVQNDFILGLHRDVGLVSRTFVAEAGLKGLISLSGSKPEITHELSKLYDALPPEVQTELQRLHSVAVIDASVPKGVILIPSITGIVKLYNNLYQELRYPKPKTDESYILSAWHNLDLLIGAIFVVATSHESQRAMRHVWQASIG